MVDSIERTGERPCPCGSGFALVACCAPFVARIGVAPTAETLMRSRYTAFVLGDAVYLLDSWHPSTRPSSLDLDAARRWLGLKIVRTVDGQPGDTEGTVEFIARYKVAGRAHRLHESSSFLLEDGRWFYARALVRE